jgi:hypothetical protein
MHQLMEQNQECKCFMDYSAENRPVIINLRALLPEDYPARQNSFDPGHVGLSLLLYNQI